MILAWLVVIPIAGLLGTLVSWSRPQVQAWLAWGTCLLSLATTLGLWQDIGRPLLLDVSAWPAPYGIRLQADTLSRLMITLTGIVGVAATTYQLGETAAGHNTAARDPAYYAAFPLLLLGLNGVFVTGDVFNFYVCFELVAISSYLLVAMGVHAPLEAAWKYSAQSVLGSLSLLVGIVFLYGSVGQLSIATMAGRLSGPVVWAAPFFLIAFLLKGALFPFHYWQPDAHAAATTAGSMLLAGLLINVGLYGIVRFGPLLLTGAPRLLLMGLGGASLIFGAVGAWRQRDGKRLLGYSSISQLGIVLLATGEGSAACVGAGIFYLLSHAVTKALLFATTGAVIDPTGDTALRALTAGGAWRPWATLAYGVGVVSLAGLPPTLGFVGKIGVLQEFGRLGAWPVIGLIGVGSVLTLAYGIRAFQTAFWETAPDPACAIPPLPCRLAVLGLGMLVLGGTVAAPTLWEVCLQSGRELSLSGLGTRP
jgi:multicomponent Na+:H+ antiporter subunit D